MEHNFTSPDLGSGVICEIQARPGPVIPAEAGIYFASHRKCAEDGMDSRFRGNDRCFERDSIPNGAPNPKPCRLILSDRHPSRMGATKITSECFIIGVSSYEVAAV